ncbi:MAG TPA: glycosyltransferase [Silvibacterium sp.]|nr:glycosyltransferase [Silvibacterium sp.]
MHFVIFGLTVSSSWGNGHATLWRSLLKALRGRGHTASFYEKNVPYYANARDGWLPPDGIRLRLYDALDDVRAEAVRELATTDVAFCTSYCPDGPEASQLILDSDAAIKSFYDLDTPITLKAVDSEERVPYLPPEGLGAFDLVLSYTGGRALEDLQVKLGARRVAPLYGSVDPETHFPTAAMEEFRGALSYLGTYAADRQRALEELFLKPAARMPEERFVIGGAQYPESFPWTQNLFFVRHLPPSWHPAFFCSARATLNITRSSMAEYGYCPSGRLFEAAACGAVIVSDWWEGLDDFFTPGKEILRARSAEDVENALALSDGELREIGRAARRRTLEQHTAARRVAELEAICEGVIARQPGMAMTA